ncbi:MAG: glycosyltransferase family 39 protein [Azoarcus sp.]|nr:glycosyltransferase family 39 protein [Azoarcus sp.]
MMQKNRCPDIRTLFFLALPLVAFLLRLGGAPLFDDDEGAFSEATREMFERGDFLSTYLNGAHRFDKPILIYWLQAAAYFLFHGFLPVEWVYRLPSAGAAMLWCYAVWHFARPRFGSATAQAALAVTATALGPLAMGRVATADALLNLLLALALFDAWRCLESGRRAPRLRCYAWVALGALTKGPIALIVPGVVISLYCASRRDWKWWLRMFTDPVGWVIFLVLTVPWYAAALTLHGQDFIDGFILKHNVKRFTATLEGHAGSLFYYVVAVPLLLLPWTGPLFAALRRVKVDCTGSDDGGLRRYLWLWAGFVIVFFSLSGTKLPHYALYGATPLFLLIAAHREGLRNAAHLTAPTLVFVFMLVAPALCVYFAGTDIVDARYRARLAEALTLAGGFYYAVCAVGLLACLTLLAWRRAASLWKRLLAAACLQTLTLALVFEPWLGAMLQGPVKDAALFVRERGEPVTMWKLFAPSVSVYREAVTPSRAPQDGELAIARADKLPEAGFEILFRRAGIVVVRKISIYTGAGYGDNAIHISQ